MCSGRFVFMEQLRLEFSEIMKCFAETNSKFSLIAELTEDFQPDSQWF
jgi:hypothetical protein